MELIRSLESQGCRIQWAKPRGGNEKVGAFPAKAYPPDPDKHFILLHDTVSSPNDVIVKRTEVQRAGLIWPFDDRRHARAAGKALARRRQAEALPTPTEPIPTPKEDTVSAVQTAPEVDTTKPMQHVRFPPGARNFATPTPEALSFFADAMRSMEGAFWTADALATIHMREPNAYKGSSGNMKAQGMLDFLGYRVIEVKKVKAGFAYRWIKDPNAEVGAPESRSQKQVRAAVTRAEKRGLAAVPKPKEPTRKEARGKTWVEPGGGLVEAMLVREAQASIALDKDPEVQTLSEAEKPQRVQCKACEKWFTPDGFERHKQQFSHDNKGRAIPRLTQTGAGPEAQGVTNAAGPVPSPQGDTLEVAAAAIEALRGGPVDLVEAGIVNSPASALLPTYEVVPKTDYEAMEQQAQEYERELTEERETVATLRRELAAVRGERDEAYGSLQAMTGQRDDLLAEVRLAQAEAGDALALARAAEARVTDDGASWTLEPPTHLTVDGLRRMAETMGVDLEIRAVRRA